MKGIRPSSPAIRVPFVPTIHQKLLILMRGLPGSGKSTLAQKLKGAHGIVLSTDDYFQRNKHYKFDAIALGEAHEWNQKRAKKALEKQISPVIIDNTNTQCWEMKPYALMGTRLGYHIKIMEPDNPWKWNVKELARYEALSPHLFQVTITLFTCLLVVFLIHPQTEPSWRWR